MRMISAIVFAAERRYRRSLETELCIRGDANLMRTVRLER